MAFKVKLLINGESVDGDGDSLAVQNPRLVIRKLVGPMLIKVNFVQACLVWQSFERK